MEVDVPNLGIFAILRAEGMVNLMKQLSKVGLAKKTKKKQNGSSHALYIPSLIFTQTKDNQSADAP